MLMKTKIEPIDFYVIEPKQEEIHKRLENWAAWCKGGVGGSSALPMFRLYRPDNFERGTYVDQVDGTDAQRIAKGLVHLPTKHRVALNWFYVKPVSPLKTCKALGLSMEGLNEHVREGRQMLINRKV